MGRSSILTIGFLLVMIGVQLNMVDTYTLTSSATQFLHERLADPAQTAQSTQSNYNNYNRYSNSTYYQASFPARGSYQDPAIRRPGKQFTPPTWMCWPVLFMGIVMVLHGAALRN